MADPQGSIASRRDGIAAEPSDAAVNLVLQEVPRGAFALSGAAVAILLLCWLITYFVIFLPRGVIG